VSSGIDVHGAYPTLPRPWTK